MWTCKQTAWSQYTDFSKCFAIKTNRVGLGLVRNLNGKLIPGKQTSTFVGVYIIILRITLPVMEKIPKI